jgi:hypothetical protein
MTNKQAIITIIFSIQILLFAGAFSAQKIETIRIRKNPELIYFFQKGLKSDTISNRALFYFIVPDSLKRSISVFVDNAQLISTSNDSLLQLNYLKGLTYETLYERMEDPSLDKNQNQKKMALELKTLVNGTSMRRPEEIFIRILNKQTDKVILENLFYFKN